MTRDSNLTALSVEEGSVVNGIVFVDGAEVDTSAGGTWTGQILITAAEQTECMPAMLYLLLS